MLLREIGPLFDRLVLPTDIRAHLSRLHAAVIDTHARTVIELGTRTGVSTLAFLAAVEQTGGAVWSCDVNPPDVPDVVRTHPAWTFRQGDDLAMVAIAPRPCDVLFIDTSHTYDHTRAELAAYAPLVREGGVIVMHDTDPALWPDCARALWDWLTADAPGAKIEYWPGDNGLTVIRP